LIDITDPNKLKTSQSEIVKLMETATNSAAALGTVKMRVEIQSEFMTGLIDSMRSGVGAIQDANMEEASARLRALQVQQQLGMQTLSIANSTPETLLALFR
jgi:flagellin